MAGADWEDEPTPVRPISTGIQLADLASADVAETLGLPSVPPETTAAILHWQQTAVHNALKPEREECDRQRRRAEDAERRLEATQRELNRARNALRND